MTCLLPQRGPDQTLVLYMSSKFNEKHMINSYSLLQQNSAQIMHVHYKYLVTLH